MKAALFAEEGKDLLVEDVSPLPPGKHDVVVQVGASGVCHTDLSVIYGYVPMPSGTIMGHEGTGRVVAVGERVTSVRPGDRVIAAFTPACGTCWFCIHNASHLCAMTDAVNIAPRARRADGSKCIAFTGLGTFSEQITVHEASVVRIETKLPDDELALFGCGVTTGMGAVLNTARAEPGSSVAVLGCGGVGQAVIQGARIAGAFPIIAVDPVGFKRDLAASLGATSIADPDRDDIIDVIKTLTGGRGADFVFEAVGLEETILQAFSAARRGGTIVVIGMPRLKTKVQLSAFRLFYEEKRLIGSYYGSAQIRRDLPRFVQFAETGQLNLASMVSQRISLEQVNDALHAIESGTVLRSVILHDSLWT